MLGGDVENAEFDALVNLLHLRSNVLEPRPVYKNVDAEEDLADVESDCLDIIHPGGPESSRDRFLDGFAELASNHKGGQHVKCSALQEHGDEVHVYVSSNSAFSSADEVFFGQLQSRLTELCNQCKGDSELPAIMVFRL